MDFVNASNSNYDIKAAGLNHFIWLIDVRRRESCEDIYPIIRRKKSSVHVRTFILSLDVKNHEAFELLTQHMFDVFGLLLRPGDTHRQEMWLRIRVINSGHRSFDIGPNPRELAD